MRTEDLITLLAQTPPPKPPLRLGRAIAALVVAIALLTLALLGPRHDIAVPPMSMLHKGILLLSVVLAAASGVISQSVPVAHVSWSKAPITAVGILFSASLLWEWSQVPAAAILHSFTLKNFPFCLGAVSLYGLGAGATLTWLMRFYAPAHTKAAATAIGFAAAAAGALGYSIHCPIDSPTFILIAYGLPIGWVTLAARSLVASYIRW